MSKVGEWLFELRSKHHLRLIDVSKKFGKSIGFISQVESGSKLFPESLIEKAAIYFDASVDYFKAKIEVDKSVIKLKKAIREINFADSQQVVAIARTLDEEGVFHNLQGLVESAKGTGESGGGPT